MTKTKEKNLKRIVLIAFATITFLIFTKFTIGLILGYFLKVLDKDNKIKEFFRK